MPTSYELPSATIISASQATDVITVAARISRAGYLNRPIAPADLRETDPFRLIFPFHQLIGREGPVLVFETYSSAQPMPKVGSSYTFCAWLLPEAFNALLDHSAVWVLSDYPDDGDHEHCLFSSEAISAYSLNSRAYHSDHGWITVAAYNDYIVNDFLRIRRCPRSIELAAK